MREPSLRPERSASANSATPAFFLRSVFYLKGVFCQPKHDSRDGKSKPFKIENINDPKAESTIASKMMVDQFPYSGSRIFVLFKSNFPFYLCFNLVFYWLQI